MAIRILKHVTVTCDLCKEVIAEFDVFLGSTGVENAGEVRCTKCSEKKELSA